MNDVKVGDYHRFSPHLPPFLDFKIKHCDRDTSSQETGGWHWPWLCRTELPWQERHRNKNPEVKGSLGNNAFFPELTAEEADSRVRVVSITHRVGTWPSSLEWPSLLPITLPESIDPRVYFLQVLFLMSTPPPWLPKSSPRLTEPCLLENSVNCRRLHRCPHRHWALVFGFYILCFLIPFLGLNYDYTTLLHRVDFK